MNVAMGGRKCLAKLLATSIAFLLVSDTAPAASELPPDGGERMLPPSLGLGDRVGWRKINPTTGGSATSISVTVKNEELRIGPSIRILRSVFPSPPPAPRRTPPTIFKSPPPPRPPTSPIHHHPPPPPCQQ